MEAVKEGKEGKDFFEELGLQVTHGDIEIGQTYPIFGMITKIINDTPGEVEAEINFNIRARMNISDAGRVNVLKERAFESGIFVAKIVSKEPQIRVECQTVIFGRKQAFNA